MYNAILERTGTGLLLGFTDDLRLRWGNYHFVRRETRFSVLVGRGSQHVAERHMQRLRSELEESELSCTAAEITCRQERDVFHGDLTE